MLVNHAYSRAIFFCTVKQLMNYKNGLVVKKKTLEIRLKRFLLDDSEMQSNLLKKYLKKCAMV